MTVAVQLEFRGATLAQYDEITERIGLLPGGPAMPHEFSHWVTKTEDGFRVTDVWENQEAFEKFSRETLGPIYQEVGVRRLPEIQFFEVHNYLGGGRWRS
jgi:hypothetical protein